VAQVQFQPGAISWLSLLLVLALLRGFFSGFSSFSPPTKTNISKFQFDQDRGPTQKPPKADVFFSLNILIYSFRGMSHKTTGTPVPKNLQE